MKIITLILISVLGVYSEIFILNLQLKSVDRYVSALKYQTPVVGANESDLIASSTLPYNDEDNVAYEQNLVPSEYSLNGTEIDNETQIVLSDMYIEDYTFNSSEYNHVKDL